MVRIYEVVVLPQSGSVLLSMVTVATKDHIDARGRLGHNLWPWWYLRAVQPPGTCWSERPVLSPRVIVLSCGPGLLLSATSGSVDLQQPGSELISMTPFTIQGHADGQGLVCRLKLCQTNCFQIFIGTRGLPLHSCVVSFNEQESLILMKSSLPCFFFPTNVFNFNVFY